MARSDKKEIEYVNPNDLVIVGLDTMDGPEHPLWDVRAMWETSESLAKNIMVYGVLDPVKVRQEAEKIFVVDGRQRVKAARRAAEFQGGAGEHSVKVPIRFTIADNKRIAGVMVSSNEQRFENDILSRAQSAARLHDQLGDIDEVAIAFGKTKTTIKNWFSLLEADVRVHEAIKADKISASAAIELSRYPRDEQKVILDRLLRARDRVEGAPPVTVTGKDVSEALQEEGKKAHTSETNASATPLQPTKRSHNQVGIKRTWMRKALQTERAKTLTEEQRALLHWFATGEAEKGAWFDDFAFEAGAELEGQKGTKKRGRKPKALTAGVVVAP